MRAKDPSSLSSSCTDTFEYGSMDVGVVGGPPSSDDNEDAEDGMSPAPCVLIPATSWDIERLAFCEYTERIVRKVDGVGEGSYPLSSGAAILEIGQRRRRDQGRLAGPRRHWPVVGKGVWRMEQSGRLIQPRTRRTPSFKPALCVSTQTGVGRGVVRKPSLAGLQTWDEI